MLNQLLALQLFSEICATALVLLCAVTVKVCEAGADPFSAAVKVNAETLKVSCAEGAADTVSVTGTVCVPEGVIKEMAPLHVLPAEIPDGFTETRRLVFVWLATKLPLGMTASQMTVVQLCSDAWAVTVVLLCAVTVRACKGGAGPPIMSVNVNAVGITVRVAPAADVTLRVTFIVVGMEFATMEIVPAQVVPAAIPD
jgi:hypothetical protein